MTYGRYEVEIKEDVHMYIIRLTINQVEMSDAGSYKLTVNNAYGQLNATVSLIVNRESRTILSSTSLLDLKLLLLAIIKLFTVDRTLSCVTV